MADLRGCASDPLVASDAVLARARALCAKAGLTVVGESQHGFAGGGYTFALLLAESHVTVHTWPELASATLDVYVCNFSRDNDAGARAVAQGIAALFSATEVHTQEVVRGALLSANPGRYSLKSADFAPQV
jgi:S-adenosylmethionine decarboxylase